MRHRFGLRGKLTLLATLAVAAALTVGAVLLVSILRSRLDDAVTNAAEVRARDIAAIADGDGVPSLLELPGEESAFVQVVDASRRVLGSSENVEGEPPLAALQPTNGRALTASIRLSLGDEGETQQVRVVALRGETGAGAPIVVYAGESLEDAEDTVRAMIRALLLGVPILVLLVAGLTWYAVGKTLRPVHAISTALEEITATGLHRRVPRSPANDEIGHLADTVNDTLDRLDQSVGQQRRFVADASHELRGPLASLRADLEISVTHPDVTDWRSVAIDTLADVEHLQRITEDLLLLARLDAKAAPTHDTIVDLAGIASGAASIVRRPDITVHTVGLDGPAQVRGDADQLRRLVRNVVQNAEVHASSRVEIMIHRSNAHVELTVIDDGPGIPVQDRARVFERFVRLDEARTRDSGGSGLGLAIAEEIAERHHASIRAFDTGSGAGIAFEIRFPSSGTEVHTSKPQPRSRHEQPPNGGGLIKRIGM